MLRYMQGLRAVHLHGSIARRIPLRMQVHVVKCRMHVRRRRRRAPLRLTSACANEAGMYASDAMLKTIAAAKAADRTVTLPSRRNENAFVGNRPSAARKALTTAQKDMWQSARKTGCLQEG